MRLRFLSPFRATFCEAFRNPSVGWPPRGAVSGETRRAVGCSLDGEQVRGCGRGAMLGAQRARRPRRILVSRGRHHPAVSRLGARELFCEGACHAGQFRCCRSMRLRRLLWVMALGRSGRENFSRSCSVSQVKHHGGPADGATSGDAFLPFLVLARSFCLPSPIIVDVRVSRVPRRSEVAQVQGNLAAQTRDVGLQWKTRKKIKKIAPGFSPV
ncbi:hypothetical protein B0T14DRAFT_334282 [Immersiella caudata]|uniref:Uncharacterized protein n=1 Tax=Immersiella caudata TaxID=314043 RepID=A0AA39WCV8_9PEZI|nr:hypothetical protein B0T14DRAFT_334282 [Immersiella caudata]